MLGRMPERAWSAITFGVVIALATVPTQGQGMTLDHDNRVMTTGWGSAMQIMLRGRRGLTLLTTSVSSISSQIADSKLSVEGSANPNAGLYRQPQNIKCHQSNHHWTREQHEPWCFSGIYAVAMSGLDMWIKYIKDMSIPDQIGSVRVMSWASEGDT